MQELDLTPDDFIPPKSTKDPELGTPSLDLIASFFRYLDSTKVFDDIELLPAEARIPFTLKERPGFTVYKAKTDGTKRVVALVTEYVTIAKSKSKSEQPANSKHNHLVFQYVDYCENSDSSTHTIELKDPNGKRTVKFFASTTQSHFGKSAPGKVAKYLYYTLLMDMF